MNWGDASSRVIKSYRDWLRAVSARAHVDSGNGSEWYALVDSLKRRDRL